MATGIISIAAHLVEMRPVALTLVVINVIAYVVLWLLLLVRLILFFSRVRTDITDHVRGPGFFTVVAGTCVLGIQFWAAGTWWIPLLFILGFWRHVYKRFPIRYDPQYWGMVFPLGMYTVCTFQLSKAIDFAPLLIIPRYFIYLAFAGWLAAATGLIHTLLFKRLAQQR